MDNKTAAKEANDFICSTMAGDGNEEGMNDLGNQIALHVSAIASAMEDYMTDGKDNSEVEELCFSNGHVYDCTYSTRDFLNTMCYFIASRIERSEKTHKSSGWTVLREKRNLERNNGTDEELQKAIRRCYTMKHQIAMYEACNEIMLDLYKRTTGDVYTPYQKRNDAPVCTTATVEADAIIKELGIGVK